MGRIECKTFTGVRELANRKGLGEAPEIRGCPFSHCCDGTSCPNSDTILGGSRNGPRTPEMQADAVNRVEGWQDKAVNGPFRRQLQTVSGTRTPG